MIAQCCKCYAIRSRGHWFDFGLTAPIRASHTYCPRCMIEVEREIQRINVRGDHLSIFGDVVPDRAPLIDEDREGPFAIGE